MRADSLKGHLDGLLLAALEAGPRHGYAVKEALREGSGGQIDLPTGTIYPALRHLEPGEDGDDVAREGPHGINGLTTDGGSSGPLRCHAGSLASTDATVLPISSRDVQALEQEARASHQVHTTSSDVVYARRCSTAAYSASRNGATSRAICASRLPPW